MFKFNCSLGKSYFNLKMYVYFTQVEKAEEWERLRFTVLLFFSRISKRKRLFIPRIRPKQKQNIT